MPIKRLFFALPVEAPWPELPKGRLIAPHMRHFTLAFLGNIPYELLEERLPELPLPAFKVGFSGYFDQCLFLPEKHPNVVAWHGVMDQQAASEAYAIALNSWLKGIGLTIHLGLPWLPHVTLARTPFDSNEWKISFSTTPFFVRGLYLYESFPGLQYKPIWRYEFLAPFEEIEHTADRAYIIRGESVAALYRNACSALAFQHSSLMHFMETPPGSMQDLVSALNRVLALNDASEGCPFKAVSYHGDIQERASYYEWEMIVDV
jgi:2'-5' RNA ligase